MKTARPGAAGAPPRIVVIAGPTATGKTDLAMQIARTCGGQIVNADSMQVYQCLDIGTAKPTPEQRRQVRHHLLDVVAPDQPFHASRYEELAAGTIAALHDAGIPAIVVGGTGLYLRALLGGLFPGPPTNEVLRNRYREEARRGGVRLHDLLRQRDPRAAERIRCRDEGRLLRALEVLELTGRSIVSWQEGHRFAQKRYTALKIGLCLPREELFRRIDRRAAAMIGQGLVAEVEGLLAAGFGPDLKPMQALGYRHVGQYLAGLCSLDEAVARMQRDTRQYAKRQETWFRAEPDMVWFSPDQSDEIQRGVEAFLAGRGLPGTAGDPPPAVSFRG